MASDSGKPKELSPPDLFPTKTSTSNLLSVSFEITRIISDVMHVNTRLLQKLNPVVDTHEIHYFLVHFKVDLYLI